MSIITQYEMNKQTNRKGGCINFRELYDRVPQPGDLK